MGVVGSRRGQAAAPPAIRPIRRLCHHLSPHLHCLVAHAARCRVDQAALPGLGARLLQRLPRGQRHQRQARCLVQGEVVGHARNPVGVCRDEFGVASLPAGIEEAGGQGKDLVSHLELQGAGRGQGGGGRGRGVCSRAGREVSHATQ